jgi:beta-glucosidase
MTLAEKAGLMFIYRAIVNDDASLDYIASSGERRHDAVTNITAHRMNHFNLWGVPNDLAVLAKWQNNLQVYAEQETRLGVPVTIASDPRHHFNRQIFSFAEGGFSQFPETLGLAATRDPAVVRRFARIVREEYLAVGIRLALHPQLDLATEPRWPRIRGGFGANAELTATLAREYIHGLQGEILTATSVATMSKHFPGGGPQRDGLDPHFSFQRGQIYPGGRFDYHLLPFAAAIEAGTAAMMPYYGIPTGQTAADVGMAFNHDIITGLLRNKYRYDGVVCTDWGVITDTQLGDVVWPARAWGVEHLSELQRVKVALDAGVDQFGGERCPEHIVQLVNTAAISEERIDTSARRILRQKFRLGLFDDPYVEVDKVDDVVGTARNRKLGLDAQMRAMTLLKNGTFDGTGRLPLAKNSLKVYLRGMDATSIQAYATQVDSPEAADVAVVRLATPWYPVDSPNKFARTFHHGDLDFKGEEKRRLIELLVSVPTIVVINLDRPAVLPEITAHAAAVLAEFGATDVAVAEVLFGQANPEGSLPFELPASMEAVHQQLADVPDDSARPLFPYGFGLRYE